MIVQRILTNVKSYRIFEMIGMIANRGSFSFGCACPWKAVVLEVEAYCLLSSILIIIIRIGY